MSNKVIGLVIGTAMLVAGVVTGNVSLIVSGATSILSTLLAPSTKGPARTASEMQVQLGEQPRSAIIGTAAAPGTLVDGFNYGGKYGTDWEVLVLRLADHRCHSLIEFYVNDALETFAGDGAVSGYNDQLYVWFRADTTNDALPSVVTTNGPGWTSGDIGEGGCDVIVAYKADKADAKNPVWSGGRPRFLWVVKGAFLYDPRKDSTVTGGSGLHRWSDPATWEWSDNPPVARYNWVRGFYANDQVEDPEMLLIGRGLTEFEAPPENVIAPANLCDELVAGEKRYRVDGPIYANQDFLEVEEMFASACAGSIITREGSVEIEPGQAKAPAFAFTDDDILTGTSVEWNQGIPSEADREWVNTVVGRYVEPTQKWGDHGAPVRRDTADVIADGRPREETITLRLVKRAVQAGRVAEVVRRLGRIWGRGTVTLGPRFCEIEEGDWGTWTSQRRFGGATKTFRVEAYQVDAKWQNKLRLREIASSVFSEGDALTDDSVADPTTPPPAIGEPDPDSWELSVNNAALPSLVITGAADDDDYVDQIRFEYRVSAAARKRETFGFRLRELEGRVVLESSSEGPWKSAGLEAPDTTHKEIANVAQGAVYEVAISYVVAGEPGDRLVLGPELVPPLSADNLSGLYDADDIAVIEARLAAAGIP